MSETPFPATGMPDRDWWAALWPNPGEVVRSLGIETGMTVLDLCCGDGYFTGPIARIVDGNVYGVDLDPVLIERARAGLESDATTVLGMICADARELGHVLPDKVDYVLIANTFHGVPDKTALARAAAVVLRPGGTLAVVNWLPLPREHTVVLGKPRGPKTEMRMSSDDVGRTLEPAGFTLENVIDLPPYHYGAIYRMPLD
ncbi:class I SAM-dependent methyltransferase [bacterium]|nr:class I SAM-dependent methyltransferase [bacterium]